MVNFNLTGKQKEIIKNNSNPKITFGVRPEDIQTENTFTNSITMEAKLDVIEPMENETFIHFIVDQIQFIARVKPLKGLRIGETIKLYVDPTSIYLFDKESGNNIL